MTKEEQLTKEIESLKLLMQIHAGDICSANNEADRFIDMNKDLEDENERLWGLLKVAKCPACDGSGGIPHQVADDGRELEQCQWCYEVKALGGK